MTRTEAERLPGRLAGDPCDTWILDPDVECADPATVRALADEAWAVQAAGLEERAPFYRDRFGGGLAKVTLDDLPSLPLLAKSELKESQLADLPYGRHLGVPAGDVKKVFQTSGTTGSPSILALTTPDVQDVWRRIAARSYFATGIHAHSRVLNTFGAGPFVAGATHGVLEHLGACSIPVAPGDTARVLNSLTIGLADTLLGTATFATYLATIIEDRGLDGHAFGIRHIITGGEPGGGIPAVRDRIVAAFGARVTEMMGLGDVSPSLFGECPEGGGMHFSGQGLVWPELIDPDGNPVEIRPGAVGEPVYTSLVRSAMPVVRFRSGDIVEIQPDGCACGRTSFRIRCIGRADDMFIVRGVNVYPSAVQEVAAEFTPWVSGRSRVVLTGDAVTVEPPVLVEVGLAGEGAPEDLAARIEAEIRSRLTFRARVELVDDASFGEAGYKTRALIRR
ncbi:AMP-binding protein [Pseudonocardia ailaonensis]|uniref:AMP-binding protein n=1 Tax=Pseudonocardia ailaonensis TaxID=367279 RepID=A0ABN2N340_9PSEU